MRTRTSGPGSVPEVAHASEDHRNPQAIRRSDHLGVAHRPARLDDCACTGQNACLEPIGEGEVGIACEDRTGEPIAHPRLIASAGRPASLVLVDPENPSLVRLALRVETEREPSGDIALDWALELPARDLSASGRTSITPGVEQAVALGNVTARLLALPVPSAAFDAFIEAEGLRSSPSAI